MRQLSKAESIVMVAGAVLMAVAAVAYVLPYASLRHG